MTVALPSDAAAPPVRAALDALFYEFLKVSFLGLAAVSSWRIVPPSNGTAR
jgi:hypothetical protein